MENKFDLLSIGDATMDVYMTPTESESLCRMDTKECFIAFSYGDKIPVRNMEYSTGGNAANNAVGTVRLGLKTGIVTTIGDDNISGLIYDKLAKEGVDMTYVFPQIATTSNFSTVINYSGERTIFTYHAPRSYEFPAQFPSASWIYLTSMGESFRPFYKHMTDWLATHPEVKVAFNPGSWQLRMLEDGVDRVLPYVTMLYVNRKEAEKITGFGSSDGREKELLAKVSQKGPKIVVVTDGGGGSYAFDGINYYHCGTLPVDAYERTGAGDAFGSGCLSALIKGTTLSEALIWGTVNSASVIGYVGPQKGLLTSADMAIWLERAKSCNVKVEEL